jgi:hypothetical protein
MDWLCNSYQQAKKKKTRCYGLDSYRVLILAERVTA